MANDNKWVQIVDKLSTDFKERGYPSSFISSQVDIVNHLCVPEARNLAKKKELREFLLLAHIQSLVQNDKKLSKNTGNC